MGAVFRAFTQCGQTERNLGWLRQQLEPKRDPNLFYPDEELARERAESHRRHYQISTAFNEQQVDRLVEWMYHQYLQPRPINLNISHLAVAIHNVYSR